MLKDLMPFSALGNAILLSEKAKPNGHENAKYAASLY